jgi:hypothetical protein
MYTIEKVAGVAQQCDLAPKREGPEVRIESKAHATKVKWGDVQQLKRDPGSLNMHGSWCPTSGIVSTASKKSNSSQMASAG